MATIQKLSNELKNQYKDFLLGLIEDMRDDPCYYAKKYIKNMTQKELEEEMGYLKEK